MGTQPPQKWFPWEEFERLNQRALVLSREEKLESIFSPEHKVAFITNEVHPSLPPATHL